MPLTAPGAFCFDDAMAVIQPSRLEDYASIADCVDAVAKERRYLAALVGFPPESTRGFLEFLQQAGGIHLSVVDAGQVVGWCDVTPGAFEGLRHCGRLGMGLLPAYRGQGLGQALLAAAITAAGAKGFEKIELEVFASNASAIRLYESSGFVREGCKAKARKLDDAYDDVLVYGLFLPRIAT